MHQRNAWLDVCRSIAILLVVVAHGTYSLAPHAKFLQIFNFGGLLGVDLFFVLSGFLIGGILIEKVQKSETRSGWLLDFWMRRWLRTLPNYFLFIIINLSLAYWGIRKAGSFQILDYLIFIQNLAWKHPRFFPEAWSLSVEEIFYFTTPLLIIFLLYLNLSKRKAILIVPLLVILFSTLMRVYTVIVHNPPVSEGIRTITIYRLDALMYGVALAYLYKGSYYLKVKGLLSSLSILLIPVLYMTAVRTLKDHSFIDRTLFFTLASLAFVGLLTVGMEWKIPKILQMGFYRIAIWSFAAYLTNLPCLALIQKFIGPSTGIAGDLWRLALFFVLTFTSARFIYVYYEKKVLLLRDKIFPP